MNSRFVQEDSKRTAKTSGGRGLGTSQEELGPIGGPRSVSHHHDVISGWGRATGLRIPGSGSSNNSTLGDAETTWSIPAPPGFGSRSTVSNINEPSIWGSVDREHQDYLATHPAASVPSLASSDISSLSTPSHNAPGQPVVPNTNAFAGQPPVVPKSIGAPKNALLAWYGKAPWRQLLSKDDYITWHDGGMPHELKFTSVFVCPRTGEAWPSGRYGNSQNYTVQQDFVTNVEVIWYKKKILAEHAAAARAYDCLSLRENAGAGTTPIRLCVEEPYMTEQEAPPLPSMSLSSQTALSAAKARALGQRMQVATPAAAPAAAPIATAAAAAPAATEEDVDMQQEEARLWEREGYRWRRSNLNPEVVQANVKLEEDMDDL